MTILFTMRLLFVFLLGLSSFAFAQVKDNSHVEEIKRQWDYLDKLKIAKDKAIKKKSRRLLLEIQSHFYANSISFEIDTKNNSALLLKILNKDQLAFAHPLNRFATSLYNHFDHLRVEINPLQLKIDQAGALFNEDTNRLTLAYDNVINLKSDSYVGHELVHARLYRLEKMGRDHVYMGWLKRQDSEPPLESETYQDQFSFDEIAAYYYQTLTLLHEGRKNSESIITVKRFLEIGLTLANHLINDEVSEFAITYLKDLTSKNVSFVDGEEYDVVKVETKKYIVEINLIKSPSKNHEELAKKAIQKLSELTLRASLIAKIFKEAIDDLEKEDLVKAEAIIAESRDKVFTF